MVEKNYVLLVKKKGVLLLFKGIDDWWIDLVKIMIMNNMPAYQQEDDIKAPFYLSYYT